MQRTRRCLLVAVAGLATGLALVAGPASALDQAAQAPSIEIEHSAVPYALGYDKLDLEDDKGGFNSDYIFSMSKAVMQSTLEPALKPAALLFTVPVDCALLPFGVIAGFLR